MEKIYYEMHPEEIPVTPAPASVASPEKTIGSQQSARDMISVIASREGSRNRDATTPKTPLEPKSPDAVSPKKHDSNRDLALSGLDTSPNKGGTEAAKSPTTKVVVQPGTDDILSIEMPNQFATKGGKKKTKGGKKKAGKKEGEATPELSIEAIPKEGAAAAGQKEGSAAQQSQSDLPKGVETVPEDAAGENRQGTDMII